VVGKQEQKYPNDREKEGRPQRAYGAEKMTENVLRGPEQCRRNSGDDRDGAANQTGEMTDRGLSDGLR
jgi:hypothetical protein